MNILYMLQSSALAVLNLKIVFSSYNIIIQTQKHEFFGEMGLLKKDKVITI